MKQWICFVLLFALLGATAACGGTAGERVFQYDYGVFLGIDKDLSPCEAYQTVVIDAQYFSEEEIGALKAAGHTVYSYLNVGSLEDFRDYYNEFSDLALGAYEHWEEEVWIDVSDAGWQDFILNDLAEELKEKGIDGYFVDNCDVYYEYPTDAIFGGLVTIMEGLIAKGRKVVVNSGNDFVDAYTANGGDWRGILTGINQETVFSAIDWDSGSFTTAAEEDHAFFRNYIETYGCLGAEIYLLEYTTDPVLIGEIAAYCAEHGFVYYISDSIELT